MTTQKENYPDNFVELYIKHCELRDEEPNNQFMFEILNQMMEVVNQNLDMYKMAFNEERVCITIPYELSKLKDVLPPNGILEDGTEYILESPMLDHIRVSLLDYDFVNFECATEKEEKAINAWLLRRIGKAVNLGWDEYCDQYIVE